MNNNIKRFPIYDVGYVFNPIVNKYDIEKLKFKNIEIDYPCRLDAMAIDPSAVVYNDELKYQPGEVVISIEKFINIKIKVIDQKGGKVEISDKTKRAVLAKHAYSLITKALNIYPSLFIEVIDSDIPKHCGFGSSSSTIAGVSAAINELYGNPINAIDLIKYVASNHGEEVSDQDTEHLKAVQCIGGGANS